MGQALLYFEWVDQRVLLCCTGHTALNLCCFVIQQCYMAIQQFCMSHLTHTALPAIWLVQWLLRVMWLSHMACTVAAASHVTQPYGLYSGCCESCDSYSTASYMACTVAAVSHLTHIALLQPYGLYSGCCESRDSYSTASHMASHRHCCAEQQDLGEPSNLPALTA